MKLLVGVLLVVLAGCAQAPHSSDSTGASGENGGAGQENQRARIHTELGAGYYARGQYAVALDAIAKALSIEPNYAAAYSILGLVRAELREDQKAEEAFKRALSLDSKYSEAHNNFGLFLCQRGRHEEGLKHFDQSLNDPLYSTPEKALVNAGACSLAKGNIDLAESFFVRAIKRAPNYFGSVQGMAEIDFRRGRWLAARNKLRQLSQSAELGAQALWLGVRVERALGDRAAEASYDAQLRRRFPDAMQTQWLLLGQFEQGGGLL